MFRIVLVHPEIPPNTGNVIRLAANTGCELHLIEPLGFAMEDRLLRRAGLDYHEWAQVRRHASVQQWLDDQQPDLGRCCAFSSSGTVAFSAQRFEPGDWLVFGRETAGLDEQTLALLAPAPRVRLPMRPQQRSLNLSNAVAVVVFEAWRQHGYSGGV